MKPHPRPPIIRKTIKWGKYGGAAVTVLLVVVWIGSGWFSLARGGAGSTMLSLDGGQVEAIFIHDPSIAGELETIPAFREGGIVDWKLHWRCGWLSDAVQTQITMALWLPALICLAPTVLAWRLDTLARRRAALNLCPKCRYDRTGLPPGAACPECGTGATAHARSG